MKTNKNIKRLIARVFVYLVVFLSIFSLGIFQNDVDNNLVANAAINKSAKQRDYGGSNWGRNPTAYYIVDDIGTNDIDTINPHGDGSSYFRTGAQVNSGTVDMVRYDGTGPKGTIRYDAGSVKFLLVYFSIQFTSESLTNLIDQGLIDVSLSFQYGYYAESDSPQVLTVDWSQGNKERVFGTSTGTPTTTSDAFNHNNTAYTNIKNAIGGTTPWVTEFDNTGLSANNVAKRAVTKNNRWMTVFIGVQKQGGYESLGGGQVKGNIFDFKVTLEKRDTTADTITAIVNNTGWSTSKTATVTITKNGNTAIAPVSYIKYKLGENGAWTDVTVADNFTITATANGTYDIETMDLCGNKGKGSVIFTKIYSSTAYVTSGSTGGTVSTTSSLTNLTVGNAVTMTSESKTGYYLKYWTYNGNIVSYNKGFTYTLTEENGTNQNKTHNFVAVWETFSASDLTTTYSAENKTYTAPTVSTDRVVEVVYGQNERKNVGEYNVTFKIYNGSTSGELLSTITGTKIIIVKKTINNIIFDSVTYNANQQIVVARIDSTELATSSDSLSITVSNNFGTDAGTYNANVTLGGASLANYQLSAQQYSFTIKQKTLAISGVKTTDRDYDGTNLIELYGGSLSGIIETDKDEVSFTFDGTSATIENKNVGNDKEVQVKDIKLTGDRSSNYTLTQPANLTVSITQRKISVDNITTSKTYDGLFTNVSLSGGIIIDVITNTDLSSLLASDGVTFVLGTGTATSKNVGANNRVITNITLDGNEVNGNYIFVQPDITVSITPKEATITGVTANDKTYDGLATGIILANGTLEGILDNDSDEVFINWVGVLASVADKNVANGKKVTISNLALSGNSSNNYALTQLNYVMVNILPKPITIDNVTTTSKVYNGSTDDIVLVGGNLQGLIDQDSVAFTLGNGSVLSKNVGNNISVSTNITLSGAQSGNYTLTQPSAVKTNITAKGLTITGVVGTKVYDGGNNNFVLSGGSLSGVISNDVVSAYYNNAITSSSIVNVGADIPLTTVSNITLSGTDALNYTLTQPTEVKASITAKELTIKDLTATKVYDGLLNNVILSGGILVGVLATDSSIGFDLNSASCADKNVNTASNVVTTNITLTNNSNGNYTIKQPSIYVTITPKQITIDNVSSTKVYDGTKNVVLTGGSLNGVLSADNMLSFDLNYVEAFSASKDVKYSNNQVTTFINLTSNDEGNYKLTQPTVYVVISAKTISISGVTADEKTYNGRQDDIKLSGGQLVGVEDIDSSLNFALNLASSASKDVLYSNNAVTTQISLTYNDMGNYSLTQPTDIEVIIVPKALTVTLIRAEDRAYDGTNIIILTDGYLPDLEEIDREKVTHSIANGWSVIATVGTNISVTIGLVTISGEGSSNYTVTQPTIPTSVNITPLRLTVMGTEVDQTKEYDHTTGAIIKEVGTLSIPEGGLPVGITAIASYNTYSIGIANTKITVKYTLTGDANNTKNYLAPINSELHGTITKRQLYITAPTLDGTKVYDGTTSFTNAITLGELTNVVDNEGGSANLRVNTNASFTSANVVNNNGNKINIEYYLDGSKADNYLAPIATQVEGKITTREITIAFSNSSVTYNGEDQSIIATVNSGNVVSGDDILLTVTNGTQTDAGKYNVTAVVSNTNYSLTGVIDAIFEIIKKASAKYTIDDITVIYDGVNYSLTIKENLGTEVVEVEYSYSNDNRVNVGIYTVTAKITVDANTDPIEDITATLTVTAKPITLVYNDYSSWVYMGSAYTVTATITDSDIISVGDQKDDLTVKLSGNTQTNAGNNYTATATLDGNAKANYSITNASISYAIAKATISGITLQDESFTYNAQAHYIYIGGTLPQDEASVEYESNGVVNVLMENGAIGKYKVIAHFTVSDNYNQLADIVGYITINPFSVTVEFSEYNNLIYNGFAHTIKIVANGAISGEDIGLESTNYSNANAGTYTASTTISNTNYVLTGTTSQEYTIAKATINDIILSDKSFEYDGAQHSLAIDQIPNIPNFFESVKVSYTNNVQSLVNRKTDGEVIPYQVTVSFTVDDNFNQIESISGNLTIEPKDITLTFSDYSDKVYTASAIGISVSANDVVGDDNLGLTLNYCKSNDGAVITSAINAGSYRALASITNKNYNITSGVEQEFTIAKATLNCENLVQDKEYVYDAQVHTLSLSRDLPTEITVAFSNQYTNVGEYNITATFTVSDNYNTINDLGAQLCITQAPITVTYTKGSLFVYNGNTHTITATYNGVKGSDQLNANIANNIATLAGEYKAVVTIGNNNYSLVNGSYDYVVERATIANLSVGDKNIVYNGSEHSLVLTGNLPNNGQVSLQFTNNKHTNVGTYIVTAKFTVSTNYNDIDDINATLTISPVEVNVVFKNFSDKVYDGKVQDITASYTDIYGSTIASGILYSNKVLDAGIYTAKAVLADTNYQAVGQIVQYFEIKPKDLSIEFEVGSYTYNGLTQQIKSMLNGVLENDTVNTRLYYGAGNGGLKNAGAYTINASIDNPNYVLVGTTSTYALVQQVPLIIGVENISVLVGAIPSYNFTYNGFIENENASSALGVLPYILETFNYSGIYKIIPSGATSRNYSITYNSGILIVNQKQLISQDENVIMDGEFAPETKLVISMLEEENKANTSKMLNDYLANSAKNKGYKFSEIVDIKLKNGEEIIQLDGTVLIRLAISPTQRGKDYYNVARIRDDGTIEIITNVRVIDGKYLEFEAQSLTSFSIITSTDYSFILIIGLTVAGIIVLFFVFQLLRKKLIR